MIDAIDFTDCTFTDNSARSLAHRDHARIGQRSNVYSQLPEREAYMEFAKRNGQTIAFRCVFRWAGTFSYGEWKSGAPTIQEICDLC